MKEQIEKLKTENKVALVSKVLMMVSAELESKGMEALAVKMSKAAAMFYDQIDVIRRELSIKENEQNMEIDPFLPFNFAYDLHVNPQPHPNLKQGEKIIAQHDKDLKFFEKKAMTDKLGRDKYELYKEFKQQEEENKKLVSILDEEVETLKPVPGKTKSFRGKL